ncbi:MAG: DNA adenine methylase [Eubacterium sp.]|nr:DNA adenine methylase [Eubacterium sp.]
MENEAFLSEQIITYIGNKRKLLPYIDEIVWEVSQDLRKDKLSTADLFSGSGIVARLLKQHSSVLITNDLEDYSRVINDCYLTDIGDFDEENYDTLRSRLDDFCTELKPGIITENYAPADDENIRPGERVFYTTRNAAYIDTVMQFVRSEVADTEQKFFIAPLLHEASVHANTSGVFKGFYKNSQTGIGQYGGNAKNCLERIRSDMVLKKPVFSDYSCEHISCQKDANTLAAELEPVDLVYLDPPYNQHSYGSNYFMLNTICRYQIGQNLSRVSGIPNDWHRSPYNKNKEAYASMEDLIRHIRCRYALISYNSEGFISRDEMLGLLEQFGTVTEKSIRYNTFRGSRNLRERDTYVREYLYLLRRIP